YAPSHPPPPSASSPSLHGALPIWFVPIATVTFPVNPVAVFPCASCAVTCTAGVIAAPAAVVLGCTENTSCVAVPAVPFAVNVTGLPESDPDAAVSVFCPAVGPSVQLPTAAIPLASVVWAAPVTLPLPGPGAKVTDTPDTGL